MSGGSRRHVGDVVVRRLSRGIKSSGGLPLHTMYVGCVRNFCDAICSDRTVGSIFWLGHQYGRIPARHCTISFATSHT